MCDPVTAIIAISTTLSVVGQVQAADAAAEAAQVQGESINRQAGQELDAANAKAALIRKAARAQAGEARAAFSASGVSVDEGTPLKINEEITRGGEYDALNTILSGTRTADSLSDEAMNTINAGKARQQAGYMGAFGSVLSAGSSAMGAAGWRTNGNPGFSGTQASAPIVDRSIRVK